ncbi:RluA family pseudouridine synthase [Polaromonas sp.]|uniref:RluA family pseudouridine synthase n=1 Tax=Polaromonas sp. TaxID=1869339 RepID=UPI00181B8C57|nr:RluA family pseudouridine synthase [Polaromonas sp.]NML87046.1 pseudouridine synthase [Polaromonas sp.]
MTTLPAHGLPTRHGVGPSCVGLPAGDWPTYTDFLVQRFPAITREVWLERMAAGLVVDEFGTAVTPGRPYRGHMRLYYYRALAIEPHIPFEAAVLFQDEHLVVADKPHFLPVTPSGRYLQETLLVRLKNQLGLDSLIPIHRIDRETAGLVLFSVKPAERDAYQALFRRHEVSKHYEAIAPWRAELQFPLMRRTRIVEGEPFFRQREAPGEPNSVTQVDVLQVIGEQARYALRPVTGKKHQLRVHMNALGIPIINDRIYPPVPITLDDDFTRPLQLLAKSIAFADPFSGQARQFDSRLSLLLA